MKTAVELLVENLIPNPNWVQRKIIKKYKELEKQQIIKAHGEQKDYSDSQINGKIITGEQYYNKTFKSE